MKFHPLRKVKAIFFGRGERNEEPATPFFSNSEIASLKLRAKDAKDSACAEVRSRAIQPNAKLVAARKAGANV